MLKSLFRPSLLIALSAAVVVGAVFVVFRGAAAQGRPTPMPVRAGEREIVWLYPATSAPSWQRFVAAVRRTAERLRRERPDIRIDDRSAFPSQTTTVPQVVLSAGETGPRFVFRWYKLTGEWKASDWIEALLKRQPPPLAIVGGSSSDSARELALHLQRAAQELTAAERPLLLLTAATADRVAPDQETEKEQTRSSKNSSIPLTRLYPDRTFRFCFSNEQMALAVSDFIWRRDDLRPSQDPAYMATWDDDSYSRDLIDGFHSALRQVVARDVANLYLCLFPAASDVSGRRLAARERTNPWEWTTIRAIHGGWPPGRNGGIFPLQRSSGDTSTRFIASDFRLAVPPLSLRIASSVGAFDTPNPYEAAVAGDMLEHWLGNPQPRPLVIVAGQSQPSRRFLRGLIRGAPSLSKRADLVVATGDAISFNTVYRDREVAWNIQDLPFPLVFFCHRNPIDAGAGFRAGERGPDDSDNTAATGTEDVLLFGDIVEAVVQTAAPADAPPCLHATELAERLGAARREEDRIGFGGAGVPLFDGAGQRCGGTGEHVVCLKPMWNEDFNDRLLPRATLEVWAWRRRDWSRGERGQHWVRRGEPLSVGYSDRRGQGGKHGGP
jgi:hypothetical protein